MYCCVISQDKLDYAIVTTQNFGDLKQQIHFYLMLHVHHGSAEGGSAHHRSSGTLLAEQPPS